MGVNLDTLLGAVGDLYESAADPAQLATAGSRLARLVGAGSALLFVARKADAKLERMISVTANFDASARAAYDAHFHERNVWFQRGARLPSPVAVFGGQLIEYPDFERTEFWNDWARPVGIYHTLGSTSPMGNGLIAAMGIHRGAADDPFGEEEREVVRRIIPHVARALQLHSTLASVERPAQAGAEALNALGTGLVLVAGEQKVVAANGVAERLLSKSRWMTVSAGRLRAIHPASAKRFEQAIAGALTTSAGEGLSTGGVVSLRDPLARDLPVLVSPFRSAAAGLDREPLAAILFSDPDRVGPPQSAAIAVAFGLTQAEAALVAALVAGETVASYAEQSGISFHTARAQLRTVFEKTGITRQADLIAAVLNAQVLRLG